MKAVTFKGGFHPHFDGKELSKNSPIMDLEIDTEMVFPMFQHIGSLATPIVKVGDDVLVGQKIGEASSFISANVLSSVSGKVKKIENRRVANGSFSPCIVIENDKEYRTIEGYGEERDYTKLSKEEILDIIKEAGIVGLGGAGFPTHVKLSPKSPDEIDYILINAAECEPYLTSDYRLMLEKSDSLINGIKIILSLFDNARAVIGLEDNKSDLIELFEKKLQNENKIKVCPLQTKYPQGGERSLIKAITLRELMTPSLPADIGCIVINSSTSIAISEAVSYSRPLIDRVITVTGKLVEEPKNYRVRLGVSHLSIMEKIGGFTKEPVKIISGGPMMGTALLNLDIPVVKTSGSILAFEIDDVKEQKETACIKCARCVDVCPSRLNPVLMMDYALRSDFENFESILGMECVECGACTYVCPAKRPLTQAFKRSKQSVLAIRKIRASKEAK